MREKPRCGAYIVYDKRVTTNPRPWQVTALAWLYIAVGAIGFVAHGAEFLGRETFHFDAVEVELVELVAVIAGVFLLRGRNWSRWLALAWILFHVALTAFPPDSRFAVHCVFAAAFAWILFRPEASRYFRGAQTV